MTKPRHRKRRKKESRQDKIKNNKYTMVQKAIDIIKNKTKELEKSLSASEQITAIIPLLLSGLFMLVIAIGTIISSEILSLENRPKFSRCLIILLILVVVNPMFREFIIRNSDTILLGCVSSALYDFTK